MGMIGGNTPGGGGTLSTDVRIPFIRKYLLLGAVQLISMRWPTFGSLLV